MCHSKAVDDGGWGQVFINRAGDKEGTEHAGLGGLLSGSESTAAGRTLPSVNWEVTALSGQRVFISYSGKQAGRLSQSPPHGHGVSSRAEAAAARMHTVGEEVHTER